MLKSVRMTICSMFLMGSLVMLATIPVNVFSNVMAQEYDKYGDNYSTYPTDDKKYECRTGQFEGFFVSSVEFCKHNKFDDKDRDRDNNRTETQGPQGPAGPQGPVGGNLVLKVQQVHQEYQGHKVKED